ncbi:MAG: DUF1320 domain-containing protein [Pleurocapsa sp. SU_196_0]|nr:DUF1320 domain-containing protein [Pleurocapsa sp. SU_196_0]
MYATLLDVTKRFPLETLLYAVDDERTGTITPEGEERIISVIVDASSEADSYLGQRYATPIDPVPDVLRTKVLDITAHRLLLRRGIRPDTADESLETQGKAAILWLRDIATGKASIPDGSSGGSGSTGTVSSSSGAKITSSPRVFSRGSLKDF